MTRGEELAGPMVQTIFECRKEFTSRPAQMARKSRISLTHSAMFRSGKLNLFFCLVQIRGTAAPINLLGHGELVDDPHHQVHALGKRRDGNAFVVPVHPLQIVTGRIALAPHDIPVDFIVTPEKSIATKTRISRPRGIYWDYLDEEKIAAIPLLKKMQKKVRASRGVQGSL